MKHNQMFIIYKSTFNIKDSEVKMITARLKKREGAQIKTCLGWADSLA